MNDKRLSSEATYSAARGRETACLCSISCVFNEVSEMIGASGNFKHFQGDERRTGQVVQHVMQVKGF